VADEEPGSERDYRPRRWSGLRLTAAVRMAFDGRKLVIATAGLLLLQLGWSLLDVAFSGSIGATPDVLPSGSQAKPTVSLSWSVETASQLTHRLFEPARDLTTPLNVLLDPASPWPARGHGLLAVAWLIVVWGLCGGAIARIAVIQEAQLRQPGLGEALRFAWKSGDPLVVTPFCFLAAVAFCAVPGLLFGPIYRIPGGAAVAGALLIIPLAASLVISLLIVALIAGWPLYHAALAAGADDALDAMSRTYGYINGRPILYAVGVAIAWSTGIAGLAVVDILVHYVIRLTEWSLSLTGPQPRVFAMFWRGDLNRGTFALASHRFWLGGARLLAHAWIYSFFWTAAALLYLWLRHEVDGTPSTVIDRPARFATSATSPTEGVASTV
jgi:hypothetical protein